MTKELLTVEFRYRDKPVSDDFSGSVSKTITIGIFDTLDEAIEAGNKALATLAKRFEVRPDDKFQLRYLFGRPNRLVTNTCYPTNGIQYFAKIERLSFDDLGEVMNETFEAFRRYKDFKQTVNDEE